MSMYLVQVLCSCGIWLKPRFESSVLRCLQSAFGFIYYTSSTCTSFYMHMSLGVCSALFCSDVQYLYRLLFLDQPFCYNLQLSSALDLHRPNCLGSGLINVLQGQHFWCAGQPSSTCPRHTSAIVAPNWIFKWLAVSWQVWRRKNTSRYSCTVSGPCSPLCHCKQQSPVWLLARIRACICGHQKPCQKKLSYEYHISCNHVPTVLVAIVYLPCAMTHVATELSHKQ